MKTFIESQKNISKKWFVVDAKDQVLGRMACKIATILMGKHKPNYTPFLDTGDHVVVINADKIRVTGRKRDQKQYISYSGYPGGISIETFDQKMNRQPEFVIKNAVRLMLPKNKLGRSMLKKLKIYTTTNHPHQAQQPENLVMSEFQKVERF
ncbi:50S ribosomal protein L13 [bacterium]|nr:50S ribosomal protein L13 [bacterium]